MDVKPASSPCIHNLLSLTIKAWPHGLQTISKSEKRLMIQWNTCTYVCKLSMQVLHISVLLYHTHDQHFRMWPHQLKQSLTKKKQFGPYRAKFSLSYQHLLHVFEDPLTFGHTFTPMIHIFEMKQIPWYLDTHLHQ